MDNRSARFFPEISSTRKRNSLEHTDRNPPLEKKHKSDDHFSLRINPNLKDETGRPPLIVAVIQQDYALVTRLLMTVGVDVNQTDDEGNTPLHKVKTKRMARLFLATGCVKFNKKNRYGHTAITQAFACGQNEIGKIIQDTKNRQQLKLKQRVDQYIIKNYYHTNNEEFTLEEILAAQSKRTPKERIYHARMQGLFSFFERLDLDIKFEEEVLMPAFRRSAQTI